MDSDHTYGAEWTDDKKVSLLDVKAESVTEIVDSGEK